MKGIVITTDNHASVMDFSEPLYQTVGGAVGGYIEIVKPCGLKHPLVMIVNEEGKLIDLPVNIYGSALYGTSRHGEPIVGDIVIMQEGFVDGEPDIIGLPDVAIDALLGKINPALEEIREAVGQDA